MIKKNTFQAALDVVQIENSMKREEEQLKVADATFTADTDVFKKK